MVENVEQSFVPKMADDFMAKILPADRAKMPNSSVKTELKSSSKTPFRERDHSSIASGHLAQLRPFARKNMGHLMETDSGNDASVGRIIGRLLGEIKEGLVDLKMEIETIEEAYHVPIVDSISITKAKP